MEVAAAGVDYPRKSASNIVLFVFIRANPRQILSLMFCYLFTRVNPRQMLFFYPLYIVIIYPACRRLRLLDKNIIARNKATWRSQPKD